MAISNGHDSHGRHYTLNWTAAGQLVGAYAYMEAFTQHAKLVYDHHVKTVDINPDAVRSTKNDIIRRVMPNVAGMVSSDALSAQHHLTWMRQQTLERRRQRDKMFGTAEASGQRFDWWAGAALGTTQLVRDAGFAAVAVIGAPMSGGIAFTAVATGAIGTGFGKYTDTNGNVGAAVIAGAGTLMMSGYGKLIGGAALKGATAAGKGVMVGMGVVIDSTFEFFGGLAEHKSAEDIGRGVLVKALSGGLGIGLDHAGARAVDAMWKRFGRVTTSMIWRDAATKTTLELAKKGNEKALTAGNDYLSRSTQHASAPLDTFVVRSVLSVR